MPPIPVFARLLDLPDRICGAKPQDQVVLDHPVRDPGLVVKHDAEEFSGLFPGHAVLDLSPVRIPGTARRFRVAAISGPIGENDTVDPLG